MKETKIAFLGFSQAIYDVLSRFDNVKVVCAFCPCGKFSEEQKGLLEELNIPVCESFQEMVRVADAVVLCENRNMTCDKFDHFIEGGKHLLLEQKFSFISPEAMYIRAWEIAKRKGLKLMHCEQNSSMQDIVERFLKCIRENIGCMTKTEFFN